MTLLTMFLFYDCTYAYSDAPRSIQVISILVAQASTPCIVPLIIIYLRKLKGASTRHPLQMLWIIAPAALLTSGLLLFFIARPENLEVALQEFYSGGWQALEPYRGTPLYLFFVSTFGAYRFVNYTEIVWLTVYLIVYKIRCRFRFRDIIAFCFKGGEIEVKQLQLFTSSMVFFALVAKTPIIKDFVNNHSWLMALFAIGVTVLLYFFSYVALYAPKHKLRIADMKDGWRYNYGAGTKEEVTLRMLDSLLDDAEDAALVHVREKIGDNPHYDEWRLASNPTLPEISSLSQKIFSVVSDSYDEEKRLSSLQKLMMEEQLFLQPRITLGDVAEKLDTNTTYVSRLVNNAYNLGFPEFINTLRIDYSEQYILNHREAKQDEIASKCGFLSASSFNNTFKKITGMTPKVWLASVDRATHENEARIL